MRTTFVLCSLEFRFIFFAPSPRWLHYSDSSEIQTFFVWLIGNVRTMNRFIVLGLISVSPIMYEQSHIFYCSYCFQGEFFQNLVPDSVRNKTLLYNLL